METNEAIMAFSQSEKIKAGLIWVSQGLNLLDGLTGGEKMGGEKVINAMLNMVGQEIKLAKAVAGNHGWNGATEGRLVYPSFPRSSVPPFPGHRAGAFVNRS